MKKYETTLAILTAARALIAEPEAWVQAYSATDKAANPVAPWTSTACRFCASGAIWRICEPGADGRWARAIRALAAVVRPANPPTELHLADKAIATWNDDTSTDHAAVLRAFDRAIAAAAA